MLKLDVGILGGFSAAGTNGTNETFNASFRDDVLYERWSL